MVLSFIAGKNIFKLDEELCRFVEKLTICLCILGYGCHKARLQSPKPQNVWNNMYINVVSLTCFHEDDIVQSDSVCSFWNGDDQVLNV